MHTARARRRPTLVLLGVTSTFVAWASALGGLGSATLTAYDVAGPVGAPAVVACDNFTGTTGANLNGRGVVVAAACASRTWMAHVGTWTVQTNQAASSATASAVVTVNTAVSDASVQVVLRSLNTGGRSGGVVLDHSGGATYLAAVMIDGAPDVVQLRLVVAGSPTVLATATPAFATTNTLRLARVGTSVTVRVNGSSVITATLSAGAVASLGGAGRAGLFGGNSSVRFDDFVVSVP